MSPVRHGAKRQKCTVCWGHGTLTSWFVRMPGQEGCDIPSKQTMQCEFCDGTGFERQEAVVDKGEPRP